MERSTDTIIPYWKLVDRVERAFWQVFFEEHVRCLPRIAKAALGRASTPATMRQIAYTVFRDKVRTNCNSFLLWSPSGKKMTQTIFLC